MKKLFQSIAVSSMIFMGASTASAGDFALIINNANSYSASEEDMRQEVKRLFLKQKADWSNGVKAKPLGPSPSSPAYNAFVERVLGMSTAQLAQHWLRTKQVSGQTPPRELKDKLALKLVGRSDGAFTVMDASAAANLPDNLKVLFEF